MTFPVNTSISRCTLFQIIILLGFFVANAGHAQTAASEVTAPPASLQLDPFYKKYVNADGLPIVSSEKTADEALYTAQEIVNTMLQKREDIRAQLIKKKTRVLVMAQSEMETDLPERSEMKKPLKEDKRLT